MRSPRALLSLALLAAAAACGTPTTAPTDRDLVGTWTLVPTASVIPGTGLEQMTVEFGPQGAFSVEAAHYGVSPDARGPLTYSHATGSVQAEGGELRFHPAGGVSLARSQHAEAQAPIFSPASWGQKPVAYQVLGNQLVLRLGPLDDSVVLTRTQE